MKSRQLVPIVLAAAWLFVGCSQEAPTTSVEMPDSPSASLLATQAEKPASVSDSEAPSGDLATRLGLSDAQQAALKALKTEQKAETQAALKAAKESKDRKALRDELKALRDRHHAAFLALLTDAQKATYDELKAEARKRAEEKKSERTPIEEQLGLDADQRAALETLREGLRADSKAIAQKSRETKTEREAVKKEHEALRTAFDTALRNLLTDEQKAKYDELKAARAEQQAKREKQQAEMKKRIQQTRKSPKAKRVTIEDQLGLDAGQRAALKALRLKHSADGKKIAQEARETKADRETVKKEYEALRHAFDKAFREILTDEQEAKYDQIVAGRKTQPKAN